LQPETNTFIYIVMLLTRDRLAKGVFDDPELPTVVFTTVCTKSRRPCLANPQTHAALQTAWRKCAAWLVGPYVVMPDHVHFVGGEWAIRFIPNPARTGRKYMVER
jgi:hypothetical protein